MYYYREINNKVCSCACYPTCDISLKEECVRESSQEFHNVDLPLDEGSFPTPPEEPPGDLEVRPCHQVPPPKQKNGLPPIDIPAAAVT
jgi:hypothetical protein